MANPAAGENPYGLLAALEQGGAIAWATFLILVVMSMASWYILFAKLLEQQKVAMVPGTAFGAAGAGFCRASFSTSYERIHEASERIARFLDTIRRG